MLSTAERLRDVYEHIGYHSLSGRQLSESLTLVMPGGTVPEVSVRGLAGFVAWAKSARVTAIHAERLTSFLLVTATGRITGTNLVIRASLFGDDARAVETLAQGRQLDLGHLAFLCPPKESPA